VNNLFPKLRIVIPNRTIRQILQAVALTVAVIIQITLPAAFAGVRSYDLRDALAFKARISAGRVHKYIYANSVLWEFQSTRLSEVMELPGVDHNGYRQKVVTRDERTVYADTNELAAPTMTHRVPLVIDQAEVGYFEIETSLRDILLQSLVVTLIASFLAWLSYFTINRWPLALVDKTLKALDEEQGRTLAALVRVQEADAELRERGDQLVAAQKLGRMADWSWDVGAEKPFLSSIATWLLRLPQSDETPTLASLIALAEDDGAERLEQLMRDVIRSGSMLSIDIRARRGDGSLADLAISCQVAARDGARVTRIRGTIQDITERKDAERQLEQLAFFDPLTGLANRSLFQRELKKALQRAQQGGQPSTLLLMDLDHFKEVNDSLGHGTGDELLVHVSQLLGRILPRKQFIARLGGDEFAIILSGARSRKAIDQLARKVIKVLSKPMMLGRAETLIGASIGIAIMPEHGSTDDEVVKNADLALYRAKDMGRGRAVFFDYEMNRIIQQKMALARDLRAATSEEGGLEVWLQPQIHMQSEKVVSFEALVRWKHPELGYVPPAEFIPIAESSGLICDIGLWVMRESAHMAKAWIDAGGAPYLVAVNLSAAQIWQTNIEHDVARILEETGLPPHLLCLELTESLLADHAEGHVRRALTQLKALGIKLALDDFGTGYSSLGYLIQLPFDVLKIDRVFVAEAPGSARAREVLQGIIALGHGLGMKVLAEGVERQDELALLRELGCDEVQGYYFARPSPPAAAFAYAVKTETQHRLEPLPGSVITTAA
jgi:diguanylate cyclase (GGDEF)-like protein